MSQTPSWSRVERLTYVNVACTIAALVAMAVVTSYWFSSKRPNLTVDEFEIGEAKARSYGLIISNQGSLPAMGTKVVIHGTPEFKLPANPKVELVPHGPMTLRKTHDRLTVTIDRPIIAGQSVTVVVCGLDPPADLKGSCLKGFVYFDQGEVRAIQRFVRPAGDGNPLLPELVPNLRQI